MKVQPAALFRRGNTAFGSLEATIFYCHIPLVWCLHKACLHHKHPQQQTGDCTTEILRAPSVFTPPSGERFLQRVVFEVYPS